MKKPESDTQLDKLNTQITKFRQEFNRAWQANPNIRNKVIAQVLIKHAPAIASSLYMFSRSATIRMEAWARKGENDAKTRNTLEALGIEDPSSLSYIYLIAIEKEIIELIKAEMEKLSKTNPLNMHPYHSLGHNWTDKLLFSEPEKNL